MSFLFQSPKAEAQPVWERIPPEIRDLYKRGLENYFRSLEESGGPPRPPIPIPDPWTYTPPARTGVWSSELVAGSIPGQLRGRVTQVLSGQYDPRTSPGVAAMIEAMEGSMSRAVLEPMMQRLAMAGQGPGTPMAQATAEAGRLLSGEVGRLLQDVHARETQSALALAGMGADLARAETQARLAEAELGLKNATARANYELARYGMISEQTYRDYLTELNRWQRLAEMATGMLGAYLPPPQYGPPPIVGLLGAIAPFIR